MVEAAVEEDKEMTKEDESSAEVVEPGGLDA